MARLPPSDDSSKKKPLRPLHRSLLNVEPLEYTPQFAFSSVKFAISDCPACGDNSSGGVLSARIEIANKVIEAAQLTGSFEVKSTESFWRMFSGKLCGTCRAALDGGGEVLKKAAALLDEAIQLDPTNDAAKKNREAVRQMSQGR